jgi:uncharacterized membrane protein (Fun14 family)
MTDALLTSLVPQGGPLVVGSLIGFACGYFLKKILKIAILILGGLLAFLAFLEMKGWLTLHWGTIETQTNAWVQQSAEQLIHSINNTAAEISNNGLNHSVDATTTPLLGGTVGFIPGAILGFMKG